ncbi:MAG: nucleotidyltransferase family protein [Actinomycetaceae bacterium]|nr:nucleotidyltransferase family protein [Actinomycetaceae bacterium]
MPAIDVNLDAIAEVCARYGIGRLDIFGSVARGDHRVDSDIDLLYELAPGQHLGWEITDLSDELARIFNRPVDLVSRQALHPLIRHQVLKDARPLYATL